MYVNTTTRKSNNKKSLSLWPFDWCQKIVSDKALRVACAALSVIISITAKISRALCIYSAHTQSLYSDKAVRNAHR